MGIPGLVRAMNQMGLFHPYFHEQEFPSNCTLLVYDLMTSLYGYTDTTPTDFIQQLLGTVSAFFRGAPDDGACTVVLLADDRRFVPRRKTTTQKKRIHASSRRKDDRGDYVESYPAESKLTSEGYVAPDAEPGAAPRRVDMSTLMRSGPHLRKQFLDMIIQAVSEMPMPARGTVICDFQRDDPRVFSNLEPAPECARTEAFGEGEVAAIWYLRTAPLPAGTERRAVFISTDSDFLPMAVLHCTGASAPLDTLAVLQKDVNELETDIDNATNADGRRTLIRDLAERVRLRDLMKPVDMRLLWVHQRGAYIDVSAMVLDTKLNRGLFAACCVMGGTDYVDKKRFSTNIGWPAILSALTDVEARKYVDWPLVHDPMKSVTETLLARLMLMARHRKKKIRMPRATDGLDPREALKGFQATLDPTGRFKTPSNERDFGRCWQDFEWQLWYWWTLLEDPVPGPEPEEEDEIGEPENGNGDAEAAVDAE